MIELQNVYKEYNNKDVKIEALKDINIKVEKGDIFGVIGFSGAGKSTLIRMVNALEKPSSGKVVVDGQDISDLTTKQLRGVRKQIGMVFQHFNLLNSKTVFDNVAISLKLNNLPRKQIQERVNELLKIVGLENKAQNYPDELSGGQKQRVGIARALATNPLILLCDEATSALDPQTTESILQLLKRINKEYNLTILIITHEMHVIKEICNRVAVMEKGEVIEQGTVLDVFGNPQEPTTINFVRTVINDKVPESVLGTVKRENQSRIFKLKFIGEKAKKPLISAISKQFDVGVNILFASVNELQGITLGKLTLEIEGAAKAIEQAYQFMLVQGVMVKEVYENDNYE
ncbi:MAG: phosphate transporter ATP-binding protein [Firmicutes bacterium]|nr:phosphate transporter ATP-binding protein [Bacillota bacterium]